jgi:hypothetical protein
MNMGYWFWTAVERPLQKSWLNLFHTVSGQWIFVFGAVGGEKRERCISCELLSKRFLAADRHYSSCEYDLSLFRVNLNIMVRSLLPRNNFLRPDPISAHDRSLRHCPARPLMAGDRSCMKSHQARVGSHRWPISPHTTSTLYQLCQAQQTKSATRFARK